MKPKTLSAPLNDQQSYERAVQNGEQHQRPNNCFAPSFGTAYEQAAKSASRKHQQRDTPQPVTLRQSHTSNPHNVPRYADLNGGAR
jgi:hypothetical protein